MLHAEQSAPAPGVSRGDDREEATTRRVFTPSTPHPFSERLDRRSAVEVSAMVVREAIERAGVSQAQLARILDVSKQRVGRKLDPNNTKDNFTLPDVVRLCVRGGRLFGELVRALDDLDTGAGEPRDPGEHVSALHMAVARLVTGDCERDRIWADVEATARQARRDLRRGA